jgi:hypothetical protein
MARFVVGVPLVFLASIASPQNHLRSSPQAISFASQSVGLYFHESLPTPAAIMSEVRAVTCATTNSLVVRDLNRDRKLDSAVSFGTSISILLGKGDGTFSVKPTANISNKIPGKAK